MAAFCRKENNMALQTVVSEATLTGYARKEKAWEIISDFKRYPEIMENVDDVKIIEKTETEGKSEWDITIEDAPFTWIEKDKYDKANYYLEYKSLSGDFDTIKGSWKIEDNDDGSIKIKHKLQYELGIPVIEEVLGEILKEKMMNNMISMLKAIKENVADSSYDERRFERKRMSAFTTLTVGEKHYRVEVLDLSKEAMRIKSHEFFNTTSGSLELGGVNIEVGEMKTDSDGKTTRIMFAHNLNEENMQNLAGYLKNTKRIRKSITNDKISS